MEKDQQVTDEAHVDSDGIPTKWKRWRWYAGIPAAIVILLGGMTALRGEAEQTAWNMVEKPALAQAREAITTFHTTTDDKNKDGEPDGHDHTMHKGTCKAKKVKENRVDIDKLAKSVQTLSVNVEQVVMSANEDDCAKGGGIPHGDECLYIKGGLIVLKLPLKDTKALRAKHKTSRAVQAAIRRTPPSP